MIDQTVNQPEAPKLEQQTPVEAGQSTPKKKKSVVSRIFDWFLNIFIAAVSAVIIATTLVPAMLGATPLIVLTGSMAPAIPVGHKVISQPVDVNTLKIGDVITYMPKDNSTDGIPIMHRVENLIQEDGKTISIITKGDANASVDRPVMPRQVTGKIIYTVPYAGLPSITLDTFIPQWTE